ncbi:hypothetical protein U1Q18_029036 [Sarracenia purpurea var. burkii]
MILFQITRQKKPNIQLTYAWPHQIKNPKRKPNPSFLRRNLICEFQISRDFRCAQSHASSPISSEICQNLSANLAGKSTVHAPATPMPTTPSSRLKNPELCDFSSAPKSPKPVSFLAPETSLEEEVGRTVGPSLVERNTTAAVGATPCVAWHLLLCACKPRNLHRIIAKTSKNSIFFDSPNFSSEVKD